MNSSFTNTNADDKGGATRRDPGKRAAIADAARRLLTAHGVRLTQVADVARAAGVASGTIYLYAADKDALLELAILSAARLDLPDGTPAPDPARLDPLVRSAIARRLTAPALERALIEAPAPASLEHILAEAYDLIARERLLIALLDRCAREVPVVAAEWHGGARGRYLDMLERGVRRLAAAGFVRDDIDLAAASRTVFEMIVWSAMRRPDDPLPPAATDAAARAAALALAIAGLAAHGRRGNLAKARGRRDSR